MSLIVKSKNDYGYIYILSNSSLPGKIKIGMTQTSIESRIRTLRVGYPGTFTILYRSPYLITNPRDKEGIIHKLFISKRCSKEEIYHLLDRNINKDMSNGHTEWFNCDISIEIFIQTIQNIESYHSQFNNNFNMEMDIDNIEYNSTESNKIESNNMKMDIE